jgi:hypothetical protein
MAGSKKKWITPELIVLVRSKPEEACLASCKSSKVTKGAVQTFAVSCDYWSGEMCSYCSGWYGS